MAYQQHMMMRYQINPTSRMMASPQQVESTGAVTSQMPVPKPPKPPEKPLVPYMRFSRKMWSSVRAENPELQLWDIGKIIGGLWRESHDCDKSVFQEEYDGEKVEYDKAMKAYHNSAAYQAFLASKNRAKMMEKEQRPTISSHHHQPITDSGVVIQPVDEDNGESQVSVRRLSSIRYDRNHQLIAELFRNNVVQDTRTVVTQGRITMLRKQAESLAMHQGKLEQELTNLEEKFETKKRNIEEAGQEFAIRLKKVCDEKPIIDEDKYEQMVTTSSEHLLEAYEQFKKKQTELEQKRQEEEERKQQQNEVQAIEKELQAQILNGHTESVSSEDMTDIPEMTVDSKDDGNITEVKEDPIMNGDGEVKIEGNTVVSEDDDDIDEGLLDSDDD